MKAKTAVSRRGFIGGLAGAGAFGIAGCVCPFGRQKIKLAAVGVMGKGITDWGTMFKTGLVEIVALCDCDVTQREAAARRLAKTGIDFDVYSVPFFTDYRTMLDHAGVLGIEALTVSTPDHMHGAIAIQAMKQGIHVFVQKPLVRTLWELDYFERTAKETGVITQMGNQGSSLDGLRRSTELLQSGIIGDIREVHVWTDRPVWPQGKEVADYVRANPKGDKVRSGLNWDAWIGTARKRPFLDRYPEGMNMYDPWKLGQNVYHAFTWRGFHDFGAGAFGDMACHTMNLAFRGCELGGVSEAELIFTDGQNDMVYQNRSTVRLVYKERESRVRRNADGSARKLPPVTLYWYDGFDAAKPGKCGNKPKTEIMPKVIATYGEIPENGCYLIGSKGVALMRDCYGAELDIAFDGEAKLSNAFTHEAAKAVPRSIPLVACGGGGAASASVEMTGFAEGHYLEFLQAIRGEGNYYEQTHSRCFADIEYSIPQMEGILVGCIAQMSPGRHEWCAATQSFKDRAANELVKPYIRKGWEF